MNYNNFYISSAFAVVVAYRQVKNDTVGTDVMFAAANSGTRTTTNGDAGANEVEGPENGKPLAGRKKIYCPSKNKGTR